MADESNADQLLAQMRDLALPWETGHEFAVACAIDTVREMRTAFNKFAETDPYDTGKPEFWDLSAAPGESDPAVRAMTVTFARILNHRGLLKIDLADPDNAGRQRDLSVSHDKTGDVQTAQGNLSAALDSYRASLAIRQRLAEADPDNAGRQRDLSVSHDKIGGVQTAQGNLSAALYSYQASLAIRQRLAGADPDNAGWQRDLSVSHDKIGDMQASHAHFSAALDSYQASLEIRRRLAGADPKNAGWQRDLALSLGRVATTEARHGMLSDALIRIQEGRSIIEMLIRQAPENATLSEDVLWFDKQAESLNSLLNP